MLRVDPDTGAQYCHVYLSAARDRALAACYEIFSRKLREEHERKVHIEARRRFALRDLSA